MEKLLPTLKIHIKDGKGFRLMDVPVKQVFEYKGIKFFVHKSLDYKGEIIPNNSHSVSEYSSGHGTGCCRYRYPHQAIAECKAKVDKNKDIEMLKENIQELIKTYGLANQVGAWDEQTADGGEGMGK